MSARPDYGVDGWIYVVGLLGAGAALGVAAVILAIVGAPAVAVVGCLAAARVALVPGVLGLRYVVVGKFRHRDRLLDRVTWRGDEHTLDLGTGGGLLLVGAAHRSPRGRAYGIDIWTRETSATTRTSMCSRMSRSRASAIVEARRGPERA